LCGHNLDGIGDIDADINNDGEIQITEAESILGLIVGNQNIDSLEGISSFTSLMLLVCSQNKISTLDMTQNINLQWLICDFNQITSIDLSQNPDLEQLNCTFNQLSSLDLNQNQDLKWLVCWNNQLTNIDVTQNPRLEWLYLDNNQVSSIDITQNPDLEFFTCSQNPIENLDVSQNINLKVLSCSNTEITSLDASTLSNLQALRCDGNQQLLSLNIQNGNNGIISAMFAENNSLLTCITIDNEDGIYPICDTEMNTGWCKDNMASYSENCLLGVENFSQPSFELYPNPTNEFLMILTQEKIQNIKIYSVQKTLVKDVYSFPIDVSELSVGLYFVQVSIKNRVITKKFIKN